MHRSTPPPRSSGPKGALLRIYAFLLMLLVLATGYAAVAFSLRIALRTSTTPLSAVAESPADAPASDNSSCLYCHGPEGSCTQPTIVTHPEDALKAMNLTPITCTTCHLPHDTVTTNRTPTRRLRPDVAAKLCTTCHSEDAERLFRHYHHPEKRKN